MEYKTAEYRDAANNRCTVVYHFFGDRCVFLGMEQTTVVFAEDIIKAIQDQEVERFFTTRQIKFYDLLPLGKRNPTCYGRDTYEFCEVVEDPQCVGGCPLDWLHTRCPAEVLRYFQKFLPQRPRQSFKTVASGKRKVYDW